MGQWDIDRKRHVANRLVNFVSPIGLCLGPLSRKWLEIHAWCLFAAVLSNVWSSSHGFDSRYGRYRAPRSTQPSIPPG